MGTSLSYNPYQYKLTAEKLLIYPFSNIHLLVS